VENSTRLYYTPEEARIQKNRIKVQRAEAWLDKECPGCRETASEYSAFDAFSDARFAKKFNEDEALRADLQDLSASYQRTFEQPDAEQIADPDVRRAYKRYEEVSRANLLSMEDYIRNRNYGAMPGLADLVASLGDEVAVIDRYTEWPEEMLRYGNPDAGAVVEGDDGHLEARAGEALMMFLGSLIGGLTARGLDITFGIITNFPSYIQKLGSWWKGLWMTDSKLAEERALSWIKIKAGSSSFECIQERMMKELEEAGLIKRQ
jgi:hypothetical protein